MNYRALDLDLDELFAFAIVIMLIIGVSSSSLVSNAVGVVTKFTNKVVMINFDDGWKSQMTYAKPILDKYGFKATFFIVCNYVTSGEIKRMNWKDVATLQQDRMDLESHTMDHKPLDKMSTRGLIFEIGGSKQCLLNHGINSTIFGYPFNLGSDKPAVINIVAKYYNLARSGSAPLMFLNCNGFGAKHQQTDCSTYSANGKLTFSNRYDIKSDSFFHINSGHNFNPSEEYTQFIQRMNTEIPYNTNGKITAIPIVTYHNLSNSMQDYNKMASTITVDLFAQQMKYLYDNGFKVLLLNQFGFDPTNNVFYLKK
jgi:peptidoglycan/xylan/chitin deacetylase (PgdA/CDA1 family)